MSVRPPLFGGDPLWTAVWSTVCRHIDGLSVGTTLAALAAHGVAADLVAAGSPGPGLAEVAARHRANPGFLMVAVRLLADQGWLDLGPDPDDPTLTPTPAGRAVLGYGHHYAAPGAFLALAERGLRPMLDGAADPAPLDAWTERIAAGWDLPAGLDPDIRAVVRTQLDGHVVGPVMAGLALRTYLARTGRPRPAGPFAAAARASVLRLLETQGWADAAAGRLTDAGRIAHRCAAQYWHPVTYLPSLRQVPELLFGRPALTVDEAALPDSDEAHLDRELDLHFSAQVFEATCRREVLAAVAPSFHGPAETWPAAVVDVGCGDGSVLRAVWEHVRDHPGRGRRPLRVVGVEPSPVGRELTEQRLGESGADVLTLSGDIADPAGIARALTAHGVDPHDVLWVTKSVFHDRAYRAEDAAGPGLTSPPAPVTAAPDRDGSLIRGADLAGSLVSLLERWTPLLRRHGFVLTEAHQAPVAVTVANLGRGVNTSLDATHGYSCQYLMLPEVFGWATAEAGWRSISHAEPAADALGYVTLTVDRFVA